MGVLLLIIRPQTSIIYYLSVGSNSLVLFIMINSSGTIFTFYIVSDKAGILWTSKYLYHKRHNNHCFVPSIIHYLSVVSNLLMVFIMINSGKIFTIHTVSDKGDISCASKYLYCQQHHNHCFVSIMPKFSALRLREIYPKLEKLPLLSVMSRS